MIGGSSATGPSQGSSFRRTPQGTVSGSRSASFERVARASFPRMPTSLTASFSRSPPQPDWVADRAAGATTILSASFSSGSPSQPTGGTTIQSNQVVPTPPRDAGERVFLGRDPGERRGVWSDPGHDLPTP